MPDSEMMMSASQFAQMLREKSVKFASVPDARLIEAFILRHPNYRVTYEGTAPVSISWSSPAPSATPKAEPVADPIPEQPRETPSSSETDSSIEASPVALSSEPAVSKSEPVAACFAYAQVLSMRRELSDPNIEIKEPPIKSARNCIRCGVGLPAFSKFCMECGAVQGAPQDSQVGTPLAMQTKPCAACGEDNPSARAFCVKCGMSLMKPAIPKSPMAARIVAPVIAATPVAAAVAPAMTSTAVAVSEPAIEAPLVEAPAAVETNHKPSEVEEQPLEQKTEEPEESASPSAARVLEVPVVAADAEKAPEISPAEIQEEPPIKAVKKCVLCLTVVPETSICCPGCGAVQDLEKEASVRAARPVLRQEPPPQPRTKSCSACGKENLEDSNFCMGCGKSLTPPSTVEVAEKEQPTAPTKPEAPPKAALKEEIKSEAPAPKKSEPAAAISIKPPSFASLDDSRRSNKSSGKSSSSQTILVGIGIVVVLASVSIAGWFALRPTPRSRAPEPPTATTIHAPAVDAPEPAPNVRSISSPSTAAPEQNPKSPSGIRPPVNEIARPAASVDVGELKIPSAIPKGIAKIDEEAPPSVGASVGGDSKGSPLSDIVRASQANIPRVAAPPQRVRVSAGVISGFLIRKVQPVYPQLARQARVSGTVVLQAVIGKDGSIGNIHLVSGPPMLVQSAIDAVKQWKYKPYILNGGPIEVDSQVSVTFGPAH